MTPARKHRYQMAKQVVQLFPWQKMAQVITFLGTGPIPTHGLNPNALKTTVEQLPGQILHGIYAEGTRTTQVLPANGGNGPDVFVEETWVSPDLKLMILNKDTNTHSGSDQTTSEIVRLGRSKLDAAFFEVPPYRWDEKVDPITQALSLVINALAGAIPQFLEQKESGNEAKSVRRDSCEVMTELIAQLRKQLDAERVLMPGQDKEVPDGEVELGSIDGGSGSWGPVEQLLHSGISWRDTPGGSVQDTLTTALADAIRSLQSTPLASAPSLLLDGLLHLGELGGSRPTSTNMPWLASSRAVHYPKSLRVQPSRVRSCILSANLCVAGCFSLSGEPVVYRMHQGS